SILYLNFGDQDPNKIEFEAPQLESLISIKGSMERPVRNVHVSGIRFVHTDPTFMKTEEPLLRSDWSIYRQAAVRFAGAENCSVSNSDFIDLGGNAVFLSKYTREVKVRGSSIAQIGGGAMNFGGVPNADGRPSFRHEKFVPADEMDI